MQINCYLFAQSGLNLCKQGGFCLVEAAKCGGAWDASVSPAEKLGTQASRLP